VPTFVFTSVNIPSRLDITHPASRSFMSCVIESITEPIQPLREQSGKLRDHRLGDNYDTASRHELLDY
jgi:hypothetical protein